MDGTPPRHAFAAMSRWFDELGKNGDGQTKDSSTGRREMQQGGKSGRCPGYPMLGGSSHLVSYNPSYKWTNPTKIYKNPIEITNVITHLRFVG